MTIHRSEFSTSLLFHPLLTSHTGNYTCQVVMVMRLIVVMMMVVIMMVVVMMVVMVVMVVMMMVVMMMVVMVVQFNYMKKCHDLSNLPANVKTALEPDSRIRHFSLVW